MDRLAPATAASINGAVIAARSENDTGNNPHNPMYGIWRAGADGEREQEASEALLALINDKFGEGE
mgnify:CR=1 FL=1